MVPSWALQFRMGTAGVSDNADNSVWVRGYFKIPGYDNGSSFWVGIKYAPGILPSRVARTAPFPFASCAR